jgi:capsid portal protein
MEELNFAEEVKKAINIFKNHEPSKKMAIAVNDHGLKIIKRSSMLKDEEEVLNRKIYKTMYGFPVYHIKNMPNEFLVAEEEYIKDFLKNGSKIGVIVCC